jgi:hypothetical protein
VNLIPDGLPLGVLTGEVEFGQHAFEPVHHFGMASKPRIGAALVKKGFDLFHALLPATMHLTEFVSSGTMVSFEGRSHVRHAKSGLH